MKTKLQSKLLLALLCVVLAIQWCLPLGFATAAEPVREINVVYDDSGSMISTGGSLVDTWCQAKYAMEVFAALLGTNDTLNIYAMSDFSHGTNSGPHLVLAGADGQTTNVEKIHDMITKASGTPFNSVRKAYTDLTAATADEKWLVVLTDGEFDNTQNSEIDTYLGQKEADINVMFLSMGANASAITANPDSNIFFEQAATSAEILSKLTLISTRIFAYDRLEVNASTKELTFDVPMSELTVFAQGANVSIDCIISEEGKEFESSSNPVMVQYCTQAATNYDDVIVDENLKGSILTFKDDFDAGTYSLEVSGADTIEVYYKPNVEICAYLQNSSGEMISDMSTLKTGEYVITFGFVKAGTTQEVPYSTLLGDVTYQGWVTNNGELHDTTYTSGDLIYIEEGSLSIDAIATYLGYNAVETHIQSDVFEDKTLTLTVVESPTYKITIEGIQVNDPIVIEAALDRESISAQTWEEMKPLSLSITEGGQLNYGSFDVEKSDIPGVYYVSPSLFSPLLNTNLYQNAEFKAVYDAKHGDSTWTGETAGTLSVNDTRTWLERMMALVVKAVAISLAGLLFLGYLPMCKKYLPKRLKSSPSIDATPNRPGGHSSTARGRFTKSFLSTITPYRAEVGTLKFTPPGVTGIAKMELKAAGGNGIYIKNTRSYAGKNSFTIDGSPIPEGTTKMHRMGASSVLCYQTREMSYTCVPTVK